MLIYEGTKDNFLTSVEQDTIAVEIEHNIYERMHRCTAKNEFRAWENSMEYMYKVLNDRDIPSDAGIAIEYNIPQTSKRVDFLISGYGKREDANVVLIELKQWDELEAVPGRDGLVQTYTGNAVRQVVHPSYQAWSYATLIKDYNASVQEGLISIYPCAYLHNYRRSEQDPIDAEQYEIYLEDAPAFTRGEVIKLRDFIKKSIRVGDHKELIYQIDSGRIRPSKSLQDSIVYENGRIITDFTKRAKTDQSLKGIKKLYKEDPNRAEKEADEIIKNTYRTLMTRGMKGCYVYCTDQHLSAYLKKCLGMQKKREQDDEGND